jgi:hypothetical protein
MSSTIPVLLRVASQTTKAFSRWYALLESFLRAKWSKIRLYKTSTISTHVYEIRPRADHSGVDLVSDVLPSSPLWYRGPNAIRDAIAYAKSFSRSHPSVIRVYDNPGNVIETHGQAGDFREAS